MKSSFLVLSTSIIIATSGLAQVEESSEVTDSLISDSKDLLSVLGHTEESQEEYLAGIEKRNIDFSNLLPQEKAIFHNNLREASKYAREGDHSRALFHGLAASKVFSDDFNLKSVLAGTYLLLGQRDLAEETYKYLVKYNTLNPRHHYNLGECYFVKRDFSKSIKLFSNVRKFGNLTESRLLDAASFKIQLSLLGLAEDDDSKDKELYFKKYEEEREKALKNFYSPLYYYTKLVGLISSYYGHIAEEAAENSDDE